MYGYPGAQYPGVSYTSGPMPYQQPQGQGQGQPRPAATIPQKRLPPCPVSTKALPPCPGGASPAQPAAPQQPVSNVSATPAAYPVNNPAAAAQMYQQYQQYQQMYMQQYQQMQMAAQSQANAAAALQPQATAAAAPQPQATAAAAPQPAPQPTAQPAHAVVPPTSLPFIPNPVIPSHSSGSQGPISPKSMSFGTMRRSRKGRTTTFENSEQLLTKQRILAVEELQRIATAEQPPIESIFDKIVFMWQGLFQAVLGGVCAFLDLDNMTVSALNDIIGSVITRGPPIRGELFPAMIGSCDDYTVGSLEPLPFAQSTLKTLLEIAGAPKDRAQFVSDMVAQGATTAVVRGDPEREQIAHLIRACTTFFYEKCWMPRKNIILLQRNIRKWLVFDGLNKVAQQFDLKRSKPFRALVMDERKFTSLMGQIIKHFYEPFCTPGGNGKHVLPMDRTKTIFSSLPKLSIMHARLDERLRKVAETEWPRVSSLALIASESEKLFAQHEAYALNYDFAASVLQETLTTNKVFRQTITQGEAALNKQGTNVDLCHALAAPNSRIGTFEAFYRSILKVWPPDDPDYDNMARAVETVAAAKKRVELALKHAPLHRKALTIINLYGGYSDVIVENELRLLLAESPICLVSKKKTKKDMYVYLMTDLIIFAKRKNPKADTEEIKKKNLLRVISLKDIRIVQDDPATEAGNPTLLSLLVGPPNEACDMVTMTFASQSEHNSFKDSLRSLGIKTIARDKCETASPPNPVFGVDLIEIVTAEQEAAAASGTPVPVTLISGVAPSYLIPVFVQKTIERLQIPASLECEGIFRLSGSASRMNGIRKNIENSATPFSWEFQPGDDALSIASVLKAFLRELPNPLMSQDLQDDIVAAWKGDPNDQDYSLEHDMAAVKRVCAVLERLPKEYLATFLAINTLLELVAQRASENKMNPRNLSIVFAPNYFGQTDFDQIGGELMQRSFDLTSALIAHNDIIREHFAYFATTEPLEKPAESM